MRVTTKGRYALRAAMALASGSSRESPMSIKTISVHEGISPEFLEQIFFRLRKAGIIGSVRGPGGGFYFLRPLEEISLLDLLEASGEQIGIAPCMCGSKVVCSRMGMCRAELVWSGLDGQLREFAARQILADMVARPIEART